MWVTQAPTQMGQQPLHYCLDTHIVLLMLKIQSMLVKFPRTEVREGSVGSAWAMARGVAGARLRRVRLRRKTDVLQRPCKRVSGCL